MTKYLLLFLLFGAAAQAQVIYEYTQEAPSFETVQYGQPTFPNAFDGEIVLSQALNPNATDQQVFPTYFSFASTGNLLNPNFSSNFFLFSTQNGVIVGFQFAVDGMSRGLSDSFDGNYLDGIGIQLYTTQDSAGCATHNASTCFSGAAEAPHGNWTPVKAPELHASDAVEALLLLAMLLAIWRGGSYVRRPYA